MEEKLIIDQIEKGPKVDRMHVQRVVERMYEDAMRRKLGTEKIKLKNEIKRETINIGTEADLQEMKNKSSKARTPKRTEKASKENDQVFRKGKVKDSSDKNGTEIQVTENKEKEEKKRSSKKKQEKKNNNTKVNTNKPIMSQTTSNSGWTKKHTNNVINSKSKSRSKSPYSTNSKAQVKEVVFKLNYRHILTIP